MLPARSAVMGEVSVWSKMKWQVLSTSIFYPSRPIGTLLQHDILAV